ncbi:MAG: GNAT family N-acetyltransferase [Gammaproteobacteria bacterium]|jgi:RimJ/RimL family protein N-acetyltransferase|nr:GNAT family N-acetyltransferase [Gammaproteobacteria bacterium]HJL80536.1 GNAT family N-acetyltransferase [Gammaproteobacteria bacterium]|tara:strand:+ start:162 stop:755 length:594 start_codon:yes stop_codon:yes gene_type:complete
MKKQIPLTRNIISDKKIQKIRRAIKSLKNITGFSRQAEENDASKLTAFLKDPEISSPIYMLPEQINLSTVSNFIHQHLKETQKGEGILMISEDANKEITAYYDIQFWPQWAASEMSGAIRRSNQGSGKGSLGASIVFQWLFEKIGVDLICETCAIGNVRTVKLLKKAGFIFKGEIKSKLPNGEFRPSLYWELHKNQF